MPGLDNCVTGLCKLVANFFPFDWKKIQVSNNGFYGCKMATKVTLRILFSNLLLQFSLVWIVNFIVQRSKKKRRTKYLKRHLSILPTFANCFARQRFFNHYIREISSKKYFKNNKTGQRHETSLRFSDKFVSNPSLRGNSSIDFTIFRFTDESKICDKYTIIYNICTNTNSNLTEGGAR